MYKLLDLFKLNKNQLDIKVIPRASVNKITISSQQDEFFIKVYVTSVPEDGKANKEVIKLLSKELGIAKSKITIVKGLKSSNKSIKIED
jgi:uncharacterized protein (TIGR00251 family)